MDAALLSPAELAAELGARVRSERLRQNLTQRTLAERAGLSRLTVARMEADGAATLTSFLAVVGALRRSGDLENVLRPPVTASIEHFLGEAEPKRRRGRR